MIVLLLLLFRTCSDDGNSKDSEAVSGVIAVAEEDFAEESPEDSIETAIEESEPSTTLTSEETASSGRPAAEGTASSDMATSLEAEEDEMRESLLLAGIAVSIDSSETSTLISYPDSIREEEVRAFLDEEMARYNLQESGVGYELTDEGILITYPDGTDLETRENAIAILSADLSDYILEAEEESASVV